MEVPSALSRFAEGCRDIQVVSEEQNTAWLPTTRVVSQDGIPLTEADAETHLEFKGDRGD